MLAVDETGAMSIAEDCSTDLGGESRVDSGVTFGFGFARGFGRGKPVVS